MPHPTDFDACYTAVASRDRRFDGCFVTGVVTTGIYCRPSCPARTPLRRNVRFFASPAAAQEAGLRACRRCRPELAPDAPDVDPRGDLAARALRLIRSDAHAGVDDLARQLHVTPRHLHRVLVATYGAGPAALARMHRVRLARLLVDQTALPLAQVAFAAGFGSVRQFNDAFRQAFGTPPSAVRQGAPSPGGQAPAIPGATPDAGTPTVDLTLPVRAPLDGDGVLRWAGLHAIPSRDQVDAHRWVRQTDGGALTMTPTADGLVVTASLGDLADLPTAVAVARRVFDVDADVSAIDAALHDDDLLGPLLARRPGVRIPAAADAFEGAVRIVVGQQVSAKGATTLMGRIADLHDGPGLPEPAQLAATDLEAAVGLTRQRAGAVRALAGAVADGLDLVADDPDRLAAALLRLPGIGPWTAACTRLLVLRDPDAWPTGDLALRRAVSRMTGAPIAPQDLDALAERWRPWRGYAAVLLWHHALDLVSSGRSADPAAAPPHRRAPVDHG